MIENQIQVQINQFDGPLALLLHLVQKEEMEVAELDVTKVTQQYLDYLRKMQELNFDVAGEYLYMAASLIHIKSQYCVLEDQEVKIGEEFADENLEITSRSHLIQKLEELEHFQRMGEKLWTLPRKNEDIFVRPKVDRKAIVNSILTPIDLEKLTLAMVDLIRREKRKYTVVKRDRLSIKQKLISLRRFLNKGDRRGFEELLDKEKGAEDVVITFISLLELARLEKIQVFQNEESRHIYIDVVDDLENFDVDQADGFDNPNEDKGSESEDSQVLSEELAE